MSCRTLRSSAHSPARLHWKQCGERLKPLFIALLLLLLILLAACEAGGAPGADAARHLGLHGVLLEEPLARPDFILTDTQGEPFDFRSETEGKLTFVFVGYTHCPDVCPVHMANLGAVLRRMPELESQVQVVFITADPERDTPERLREWLDAFSPRFVGLRGPAEEIREIESALDLPYSMVPEGAGEHYPVGHAGQVIAFSPDGPARIVYPFGTRQVDYAADLPRLVREGW